MQGMSLSFASSTSSIDSDGELDYRFTVADEERYRNEWRDRDTTPIPDLPPSVDSIPGR